VQVRNGQTIVVVERLSWVVVFDKRNAVSVAVNRVVMRMNFPARQPCCRDHPRKQQPSATRPRGASEC